MENLDRDKISGLMATTSGATCLDIIPLAKSGSPRRYYRIVVPAPQKEETDTIIACVSDDVPENQTFIRLAKYLKGKGIRVPAIYAVSDDCKAYLLEDLGSADLLGVIKSEAPVTTKQDLVFEAIKELVKFQQLPEEEWCKLVGFKPFDQDLVWYDFNYARVQFFDKSGLEYDSEKLEKELRELQKRLLAYPRELWGLMYRDFQSRNIMIAGKPYFIDFQSARKGPGVYDLVSFAWQAKADFSPEMREAIIERYAETFCGGDVQGKAVIKKEVKYWAIFRVMQTLGAYGLRGLTEGKTHFLQSIPQALTNLDVLLQNEEVGGKMPELQNLVRKALVKYPDNKESNI